MDSRYFSKLINSHLGILLEFFNASFIDHIVNRYFGPNITLNLAKYTYVLLIKANSPRKQVSKTFLS